MTNTANTKYNQQNDKITSTGYSLTGGKYDNSV